jgi:hypothetical protein
MIPVFPEFEEDRITPQLLMDYIKHIHIYNNGLKKPFTDGTHLLTHIISGCLSCPPIVNYICSLGDSLDTKTFDKFRELLKKCFLCKDWDIKLALSIMTMTMKTSCKFSNWVQPILAIKNCLAGTKSHLQGSELIKRVYGLLCEELCNWVDKKIDTLLDLNFEEYQKAVTEIDEFCHAHKEEYTKNDTSDLQRCIAELEHMLKVVKSSSGMSLQGSLAKRKSCSSKPLFSNNNIVTGLFTYSHPFYASQPSSGKFVAVSATSSTMWKPDQHDVDPPPKLTEADHSGQQRLLYLQKDSFLAHPRW